MFGKLDETAVNIGNIIRTAGNRYCTGVEITDNFNSIKVKGNVCTYYSKLSEIGTSAVVEIIPNSSYCLGQRPTAAVVGSPGNNT